MLRVKDTELELIRFDGGGMPVYNYQGKPFTGVRTVIDKNGKVCVEEEYENGFQEGWTRYFFENGQLETEFKSHNNQVVENTYKEWDED